MAEPVLGNFKTWEKTQNQVAVSALQDPTSPSRGHGLERGVDSVLLASKQGLEPMSKPRELCEPSQRSVGPLKKL